MPHKCGGNGIFLKTVGDGKTEGNTTRKFICKGKVNMCGIVGYIGDNSASPILIDGLKKLEYRGYDSAGIAVYGDDGVKICKTKGRIADLEGKLENEGKLEGCVGIGHTRWATHGAPDDINAHPHKGGNGRITLVHNGIIENTPTWPSAWWPGC